MHLDNYYFFIVISAHYISSYNYPVVTTYHYIKR